MSRTVYVCMRSRQVLRARQRYDPNSITRRNWPSYRCCSFGVLVDDGWIAPPTFCLSVRSSRAFLYTYIYIYAFSSHECRPALI